MYQILSVIHVILALSIIGLVLLQQGRGADAGAGFGAGTSTSLFGSRGSATFLSKVTAVCALLFFSSSLFLAYLGDKQGQAPDIVEQAVSKDAPADTPNIPAQSQQPEVVDIPTVPSAGDVKPDN